MSEVAPSKDHKPRRILLKISGEALMGDGQFGIDQETCLGFARDVKAARDSGIELCLVIGGGKRDGAGHSRLYGHAGHHYECAGVARGP